MERCLILTKDLSAWWFQHVWKDECYMSFLPSHINSGMISPKTWGVDPGPPQDWHSNFHIPHLGEQMSGWEIPVNLKLKALNVTEEMCWEYSTCRSQKYRFAACLGSLNTSAKHTKPAIAIVLHSDALRTAGFGHRVFRGNSRGTLIFWYLSENMSRYGCMAAPLNVSL